MSSPLSRSPVSNGQIRLSGTPTGTQRQCQGLVVIIHVLFVLLTMYDLISQPMTIDDLISQPMTIYDLISQPMTTYDQSMLRAATSINYKWRF